MCYFHDILKSIQLVDLKIRGFVLLPCQIGVRSSINIHTRVFFNPASKLKKTHIHTHTAVMLYPLRNKLHEGIIIARSDIRQVKSMLQWTSSIMEYMLTLTELSLLIRGRKLLGSLLNVMSRDSRKLFIPFNSDWGLKKQGTCENTKYKKKNLQYI